MRKVSQSSAQGHHTKPHARVLTSTNVTPPNVGVRLYVGGLQGSDDCAPHCFARASAARTRFHNEEVRGTRIVVPTVSVITSMDLGSAGAESTAKQEEKGGSGIASSPGGAWRVRLSVARRETR